MRFGLQMVFQPYGYGDGVDDAQVYDEEIRLAVLADRLGFDALWPVKHHFEDYAFCPDNVVLSTYDAWGDERQELGDTVLGEHVALPSAHEQARRACGPRAATVPVSRAGQASVAFEHARVPVPAVAAIRAAAQVLLEPT